jgi:hypothetical protein
MDGGGAVTRGRGHIAERVIAEDREPTSAEVAHLDTCPECFAAVRRRRPFDARLTDAARDLVTEPLPREVLLVAGPTDGPRRWWPAGGFLAALALVIVVGLGGFVALRASDDSPVGADTFSAGSDRVAELPADHVVQLPGDDVAIWADAGGALIVSRLSSPEPQVMSKVPIPASDSGGFAMVCASPADGRLEGYVYGVLEPDKGPPVWVGPPAVGQASSDGLFLYMFDPIAAEGRQVSVLSADGTGVGFAQGTFSTLIKERGTGLPPGATCGDWTRP